MCYLLLSELVFKTTTTTLHNICFAKLDHKADNGRKLCVYSFWRVEKHEEIISKEINTDFMNTVFLCLPSHFFPIFFFLLHQIPKLPTCLILNFLLQNFALYDLECALKLTNSNFLNKSLNSYFLTSEILQCTKLVVLHPHK